VIILDKEHCVYMTLLIYRRNIPYLDNVPIRLSNNTFGISKVLILDSISQILQRSIRINSGKILTS
jgi:hypothetical protein